MAIFTHRIIYGSDGPRNKLAVNSVRVTFDVSISTRNSMQR